MLKKLLAVIGALLAMVVFAASLAHFYPQSPQHEVPLTTTSRPTLWVTSDTHFIAPSLHDDQTAWGWVKASAAGKDMQDQPIAIKAFVHAALKAHPTAVIITGDVTFNGALASAKSIAKRLAPLQQAGIHVLAIPGNHDIYDGWARKYTGKAQTKVTQISPKMWRQVFADGYQHAASIDPNSLSYAITLNRDYRLLLLDSNIYTIQPSNLAPNTGGQLSKSTLTWLRQQLAVAKKRGQHPLVFMHHNLYPHASHASGWVLNNAEAVRKLLSAYQVPVVFSGHIHAQDIMADPAGQATPKEIISASFTQTPGIYGVIKLTPETFDYHTQAQDLTPVLSAKQKNGHLGHYQRYLATMFKQTQALPIVYQQAKDAGLKGRSLIAASNFLAELNWRFFSGNDTSGLTQLKQLPGYAAVMGNHKLRQQVKPLLQDHDLPDHHLFLKLD
ncbi:metallophosphoesterase [Lacticaseibacillus baoqingensis]|uniref:Metallophosphoesterase n=1 Tax=Lacticaseibacillus baoqingensis TaxID=2486013 RepID=A0ABW4E858_9LACO|nr:metallophosphoesterase [Lacticaseibacillus baoqingensis]